MIPTKARQQPERCVICRSEALIKFYCPKCEGHVCRLCEVSHSGRHSRDEDYDTFGLYR